MSIEFPAGLRGLESLAVRCLDGIFSDSSSITSISSVPDSTVCSIGSPLSITGSTEELEFGDACVGATAGRSFGNGVVGATAGR